MFQETLVSYILVYERNNAIPYSSTSLTMRSHILAENIRFQVSTCELVEEIAGEKNYNLEIMMIEASY